MTYVLKVSDCDSLVKAYYVHSQFNDRYVHVTYTDNPDMALTFDSVNDAAFHLMFIWANVSTTDTTANSLCIAEVKTSYKEL